MSKKFSAQQLIRYGVGYVFITSAIMKLVISDFTGAFAGFGIPFPELMVWLTGMTELLCGGLIIANYYVKKATIPLIIIMIAAIVLTKIPFLSSGFFTFVFEARLDLVMLLLLYLLWKNEP